LLLCVGRFRISSDPLELNTKSMMKTKLTLFVAVLAAALFGVGCASPLKKGLVAHYPLSGDTEDIVSTEKVEYSQDSKAIIFSDVKLWLNASPPTGITNSSPYSISVMIKPEQATFGLFMLGDSSRAGGSRSIVCENGQIRVGGVNEDVGTKLEISIGKWQHICVSWDGVNHSVSKTDDGGYSVWTNDQLHKSNLSYDKRAEWIPYGVDDWTGLMIGATSHYATRFHYKGQLKDFRIYNRALSAEEVKALYDLEKPKK
jgi:hypothetical protein